MKPEDKELLLKDLSARLPYGVKMNHIADNEHNPKTLIGIAKDMITLSSSAGYSCVDVEHYMPYLLPLSNITKKQMKELEKLCDMYTPDDDYHPYAYKGIEVLYKHVLDDNYKISFKTDVVDWFYKNHLDFRGLIPKGLAKDATNLNIY